MKKTKPDRFERMARKLPTDCEAGLWPDDAVKLLRRQHRAYMRLVYNVWDWQAEQLADNEDACEVIIRELKQYAK